MLNAGSLEDRADAGVAQNMLSVAREAGFRESGISLGRKRVLVQIRTLAMRLEVPLAIDGELLVEKTYFETLIRLANERLDENLARTNRLWMKLKEAFSQSRAEQEEHELWVLVCAQSHARSVKLALEGHGWLDWAPEDVWQQAICRIDSLAHLNALMCLNMPTAMYRERISRCIGNECSLAPGNLKRPTLTASALELRFWAQVKEGSLEEVST
eukprot:Skav226319  [mRNA]  locus=scaffold3301:614879:619122:- [translate_table: standard]